MAITPATSISDEQAALYRAEFPIFDHTTYLNSCSLGPLSRRSMSALERYMDAWSSLGAPAWWAAWLPQIELARRRFAQLIGASSHEVTIGHSISSVLTSVASAFDYRTRNQVVCAELDFPTIPYQWLARARDGVAVQFARSADRMTVALDEYERLVNSRTALVATSHVFYTTGAIQPIRRLADLAHARGAKVVVDAYHSVGVIPVDVKALDVDIFVGGVLKWLLGGPGLTFIYVREDLLDELRPTAAGWFASADQFAFDTSTLDLAADANRFQLGTPAVSAVYTGIAGMEFIQEAGVEPIADRIRHLTSRLYSAAHRAGFRLRTPEDPLERGGIIMLEFPNPKEIVAQLVDRHITVDHRPGLVRISPHFYNTEDDVDRVIDALTELMRRPV